MIIVAADGCACEQYMRKVDPERAYVAPGSQEMGPTRGSAVAPAHSPAHAAPGESINDREKITETKVLDPQPEQIARKAGLS